MSVTWSSVTTGEPALYASSSTFFLTRPLTKKGTLETASFSFLRPFHPSSSFTFCRAHQIYTLDLFLVSIILTRNSYDHSLTGICW